MPRWTRVTARRPGLGPPRKGPATSLPCGAPREGEVCLSHHPREQGHAQLAFSGRMAPCQALVASRSLVDGALPTLAESTPSRLLSVPLARSSKRSEPRPPHPQPPPGCWDKYDPGEAVLLLEKPAHTMADTQSRVARPAWHCD